VALAPADATRIQGSPRGLFLRQTGRAEPFEVEGGVKLVSRAPEVDPRTATVSVLLEVDRSASELPLGSAVEAEILLREAASSVPLAAVLDDAIGGLRAGSEGELRPTRGRVLGGSGTRLVDGLRPGERLVTQGAGAVRRSSLLSAGAPEGHVH
jgi:hypothetical protein